MRSGIRDVEFEFELRGMYNERVCLFSLACLPSETENADPVTDRSHTRLIGVLFFLLSLTLPLPL